MLCALPMTARSPITTLILWRRNQRPSRIRCLAHILTVSKWHNQGSTLNGCQDPYSLQHLASAPAQTPSSLMRLSSYSSLQGPLPAIPHRLFAIRGLQLALSSSSLVSIISCGFTLPLKGEPALTIGHFCPVMFPLPIKTSYSTDRTHPPSLVGSRGSAEY